MVEAGRLVIEPEPGPEPHGPVMLVIGDPGPFTAERDGAVSSRAWSPTSGASAGTEERGIRLT